ncbi:MAG: endonuclease MutS2, partial [Saprospiraceae bacterium]|nr:endonuclease MutS2 [Saprospiraceae bacterium]
MQSVLSTMDLIPSSALEILEFTKIIDLVRERCIGPVAKDACAQIRPSTNAAWIRQELSIVADAMRIHEEQLQVMSGACPDLAEVLEQLKVEGYVAAGEDLLAILILLQQAQQVYTFFDGDRAGQFSRLADVAARLTDPVELIEAIERVLDEEGAVRPDASPALQKLAKELGAKRRQCDQQFDKTVRKYADQGWLSDTLESMRNGRRVLAVVAERKRQVRGIIHDQSATGKTTFVEPEELIQINNDLIEIGAAIRTEERRILLALCDRLRPEIPDLEISGEVLTELDVYLAKARLGLALKGSCPDILETPVLHIEQGRHPLLYLKNKEIGKKTVPFDLHLRHDNRILLLSGPNAGGKSILMKSVGLMQVMVQAGLPVPADARSEFGVFERICVELGDRQSIEDDLSTYSSRLK